MKWQEFYTHMFFCFEETGDNVLDLIAEGEGVPVRLATLNMFNDEGDFKLDESLMMYIVVISIFADKKKAKLHMVVKTRGELPEGIRHGTYELVYEERIISNLPEEMFENQVVPLKFLRQKTT